MSEIDANLVIFARQIRQRTLEHRRAVQLLSDARLAGQLVAILRQELDSMIRVIYLLAQGSERRRSLIAAMVQGRRWSLANSRKPVTDKEMAQLAQALQGWTLSVYKFGCAFIHLSSFHDYNDRDPLALLPENERRDLLNHCRHYHGGPGDDACFSDLVPYLPAVFEKIAANLEYYVELLESGETSMDLI